MERRGRAGPSALRRVPAARAWLALLPLTAAAAKLPPQAVPAVNPAGLSATVTTFDGKTQFHIGERIELFVRLNSSVPGEFQSMGEACFGCLTSIPAEVQVEPATGWSDPLAALVRGAITNGARLPLRHPAPAKLLPDEFFAIEFPLNAFVRFDAPGDYTLHIQYLHVWQADVQVTAAAPPLRIHIVAADPQWQQTTFQHAVAMLDSPLTALDGMETLRYLGTPAAAREIVRRLNALTGPQPGIRTIDSPTYDWNTETEWRGGWVASPAAAAGLDEARRLFADPDTPIGSLLVYAALQLSGFTQQEPELWSAFLAGVRTKRGAALVPSVYAAVITADAVTHPLSGEYRQWVIAQLAAHAAQLSDGQRIELWQWQWNKLKDAAWLPALEPAARSSSNPDLAGVALRDWYQLAPAAAGLQIQHALADPNSPLPAWIFNEYAGPFPGPAEDRLAGSLEFSPNLRKATLVGKFGTSRSIAAAKAVLDQAPSCPIAAPLLSLLLRVAPQDGIERLNASLDGLDTVYRGAVGICSPGLLTQLGETAWTPELEQVAIAALLASNDWVVSDAAMALDHGSPAARAPLEARLQAWCARPQAGLTGVRQALGEEFAGSLAANSHWVIGETELQQMTQCWDPLVSRLAARLLAQRVRVVR